MKAFILILRRVVCVLIALFSLIILLLELRLIFSADWRIYQHPALGLLQYTLRAMLAAAALLIGISSFVSKRPQHTLWESIYLLCASVPLSFFATNYVGKAALLLSACYFLTNLFLIQLPQPETKP